MSPRGAWRRVGRWAVCACLLTLFHPADVLAKPQADAAQTSEAKKLFAKGSDLYVAKRYAEALQALKASYQLVPSPNSGLLIARCLRDGGQAVEAQEMFSTVEVDARRRAAEGEAKYTKTADAAAAEGAAVRATLGTIRIRVDTPEPGTKLDIDGSPTSIPDDGNILVWHVPGDVTVTVHPPSGLEQQQAATVRAGAEVKMAFVRAEPTQAETPPAVAEHPNKPAVIGDDGAEHPMPTTPSGSSWVKPAAWISGVLTVAGAGVFTGFGLASQSDYHDLNHRCGPVSCSSASDRSEAAEGKRFQTIANVGLIVGSVAAIATLTFVIVAATSPSSPSPSSGGALRVGLGPTSVQLGGDF